MKNVIRKIFSNEIDSDVHSDFLKFSRGVFENRYLLEGKATKEKWNIKTSAEFANFLVRRCLEKAGEKVEVKGIIITTANVQDDCDFEIKGIKKYQGIKQIILNTTTSPKKIIEIMEKHPRAFYALSFSIDDCELKIKAKPPKSAKSGTKTKDGKGPKADFCSLKTTDEEIIRDLFFDFPDFSEIKINHTLEINDIEIPNAKDPVQIREMSKRKGVVKRFVEVDGLKKTSEMGFEA